MTNDGISVNANQTSFWEFTNLEVDIEPGAGRPRPGETLATLVGDHLARSSAARQQGVRRPLDQPPSHDARRLPIDAIAITR